MLAVKNSQMSTLTRIYEFLNKPLGMWLLSSVAVGILGFSFELHKQENELTLERLSLGSEILHRLEHMKNQAGIGVLKCVDLVRLKKSIANKKNEADRFHQLINKVLAKDGFDYLFKEYASESTYALISKYEVNINRSYFRWFVERSNMPIEEVKMSLGLAHTYMDGEQSTATALTDLYTYTVLDNYFHSAYAKHYFKSELEKQDLDCGERWLGNVK